MEHETPPTTRQLGHDLRDCLHKVSLGIQILRKLSGDSGNAAEILEMMEQQQRQANKLLQQFLEVSRNEQDGA